MKSKSQKINGHRTKKKTMKTPLLNIKKKLVFQRLIVARKKQKTKI